MKFLNLSLLTVLLTILMAACPAKTETPSGTTPAQPEKPLEAVLSDMDNALADAFVRKDKSYFKRNLVDDFVNQTASGPIDKAKMIKEIQAFPCEIKSIATQDGKVFKLADGFVIRTAKEIRDGSCFGVEIPDAYMATLYVKEADRWKVAYHQSLDIRKNTDSSGSKTPKPAVYPKTKPEPKVPGSSGKVIIPNDEELASELIALEKEMLAAWSKNDTGMFEKMVSPDYVEVYPKGVVDKKWLLKDVAGHNCDIAHTVSDEAATKFGGGLVLLTYKVVEKGTCEGNPLYYQTPLHTTTMWRADPEKWQMVFHMVTSEQS